MGMSLVTEPAGGAVGAGGVSYCGRDDGAVGSLLETQFAHVCEDGLHVELRHQLLHKTGQQFTTLLNPQYHNNKKTKTELDNIPVRIKGQNKKLEKPSRGKKRSLRDNHRRRFQSQNKQVVQYMCPGQSLTNKTLVKFIVIL